MKTVITLVLAGLALGTTVHANPVTPTVTATAPIIDHHLTAQSINPTDSIHTGTYSMVVSPGASSNLTPPQCVITAGTVSLSIERNGGDISFASVEGTVTGHIDDKGRLILHPPAHATNMYYTFNGQVTGTGRIEGSGTTSCNAPQNGQSVPYPENYTAVITAQ